MGDPTQSRSARRPCAPFGAVCPRNSTGFDRSMRHAQLLLAFPLSCGRSCASRLSRQTRDSASRRAMQLRAGGGPSRQDTQHRLTLCKDEFTRNFVVRWTSRRCSRGVAMTDRRTGEDRRKDERRLQGDRRKSGSDGDRRNDEQRKDERRSS